MHTVKNAIRVMSGISWSGSRWRLQNGHVTYLLVYSLRPACKQFILIVSNESKLFVLVKTKKKKRTYTIKLMDNHKNYSTKEALIKKKIIISSFLFKPKLIIYLRFSWIITSCKILKGKSFKSNISLLIFYLIFNGLKVKYSKQMFFVFL